MPSLRTASRRDGIEFDRRTRISPEEPYQLLRRLGEDMRSRFPTRSMWAQALEMLEQADRLHRQFFQPGSAA